MLPGTWGRRAGASAQGLYCTLLRSGLRQPLAPPKTRVLAPSFRPSPATSGLPNGLLLAGVQHGLLPLQLGNGAWEGPHK